MFPKQLKMMNQIFQCPIDMPVIRISSCSCQDGLEEAPVPGVCLDRANGNAVYGKNCECSDGSVPTFKSSA